MAKQYRCVNKCFHNRMLFNVGDIFSPKKGEDVPEHFVGADEFSEELVEERALGEQRKRICIVSSDGPVAQE